MFNNKFIFLLFLAAWAALSSISAQTVQGEIGFACGFAGSPSAAVSSFSAAVHARDTAAIRDKLFESNTASQVIAAAYLQVLQQNGGITLTSAERAQIDQLKHSQKKVRVCAGCTYMNAVSVAQLIDFENSFTDLIGFQANIQEWASAFGAK